jgi:prepilin peptidase CpaA
VLASPASQISCTALLLAAGVADTCWRRIPNALTVALLVCGAAVSALDPAGPRLMSSVAAAGLVLAIGLTAWRLRLCGGGDAKLATAAAAWVGFSRLPSFAVATALAGGAVAVLVYALTWADARRVTRANLIPLPPPGSLAPVTVPSIRHVSVPYGAAIAAGALYAVLGGSP